MNRSESTSNSVAKISCIEDVRFNVTCVGTAGVSRSGHCKRITSLVLDHRSDWQNKTLQWHQCMGLDSPGDVTLKSAWNAFITCAGIGLHYVLANLNSFLWTSCKLPYPRKKVKPCERTEVSYIDQKHEAQEQVFKLRALSASWLNEQPV